MVSHLPFLTGFPASSPPLVSSAFRVFGILLIDFRKSSVFLVGVTTRLRRH